MNRSRLFLLWGALGLLGWAFFICALVGAVTIGAWLGAAFGSLLS